MSLPPLRGHTAVRRALVEARRAGSLPGSILIHGAPGVGKQRLALWIAQLLLCQAPGEDGPCGGCKSCRLAVRLEHPDLHWYFPLARPKRASTPEKMADALEEARAAELADRRAEPLRPLVGPAGPTGLYLAAMQSLKRRAQRRPATGERQVFLVAEAEQLSPQEGSEQAANAVLKLLEEPPESTTLILTSAEPGRLLPTIRSRTVSLHLAPLSEEEVSRFLEEEVGRDADEAERAARLSQGSIGRALGFLEEDGEPGPLEQLRQDAFHLLRAALAAERGPVFEKALSFPVAGARTLGDLFSFVEEWLRDLAAAATGEGDRILNQDAREFLLRIAREKEVHPARAAEAVEAVERARIRARGNVNPQLIVLGLLTELRTALVAEEAPAGPAGSASTAAGGGR